MLQDIRKSTQGTAAKVIIGLIVVSFSLFGIESILLGGGSSGVAEVNGEDISPQEVQQAVNNQKRRLIAMMGDNFDPSMIDDDRLSAQAIESLVGRKLMLQAAGDMGLAVSEAELGRMIASMEQFQLDGVFSPELYKSTLASAGYTPASFKRSLREDLLVTHLRSGMAGSDFATQSELEINARIVGEQRDLRYITLPLDTFMSDVAPSDEQVRQFYADNQARFLQPESVVLDYIELGVDDFRAPVEESALRELYEVEQQSYAYRTRNRVSHVLFEEGGDQSVAERLAAARAALDSGRPFAAVAAEFSDDIGSANNGGDLGFSSGDAFPPEMEEAIAALPVDTLSQPVRTDAGTHLILVTAREEGEPPSFEEMRMELQDSLQLSTARTELLSTVEALKDLAFNAEDLSGPGQELGLEVKRSEPVVRDQAVGPLAHPSLVAAAFSEDVLGLGHNSEVIELAGDKWVVLRVHKHNQAAPLPLDAVREEVVSAINEERARAALAQETDRLVAQLRAGASLEDYANSNGYEWQVELAAKRTSLVVPGPVLQRAFQLPAPGEGETLVESVSTPSGDEQVLQLMRVEPGAFALLEAPDRQRLRQQISGEFASLVDAEFQRRLRESADITVL
jgi:peptidyl-prolyl cis-trans isomerase D